VAHASHVKDLTRRARQQGWEVTTDGKNHPRLTPPGGGKGVSIASTSSNWNTLLNDRTRLRKAGLLDEPSNESRQKRMDGAKNNPGFFSAQVLSALQSGDRVMTVADLATASGLSNAQVSGALFWLTQKHPEVRRVERGRYRYLSTEVHQLQEPDPEPASAALMNASEVEELGAKLAALPSETWRPKKLVPHVPTNGHVSAPLGSLLLTTPSTEVDDRPTQVTVTTGQAIQVVPATMPASTPELFESVCVDGQGRLILRDAANGEIWCAARMTPRF
jgi:hypothetical protein